MQIAIVGSARSGTSALCELVNLLPDVLVTNELAFYHWWDNHDPAFLLSVKENPDNINRKFFKEMDVDIDKWVDICLNRKLTGRDSLMAIRVLSGKCTIGDKYPGYLSDCQTVIAECDKTILTIRDPRAIVASRLRKENSNYPWMVNTVKEAEELWFKDFECLKFFKDTEKVFTIRYEQASLKPQFTLNRLAKFLGTCSMYIQNFNLYVPVHIATWKQELHYRDFSHRMLETVKELGYSD